MSATEPGLHEDEVDPDPIRQFEAWYAQADDNVACLATASASGEPSARMVLLRGVDDRGFVFFTNHRSAKARDLAENPLATLVFYWAPSRQVRVGGPVERVSREESETYWQGRAREAQLAAWASWQSDVIESRDVLEERWRALTERFEGEDVPLPEFWGGYRVVPEWVEFWHQREHRLHDRLRYCREADGSWRIERLSP